MNASIDKLVILAEFSTDMEAAMVIAALEREGIEAFMKGEYTAGFRAEAPSWPKVEVRESDYERARAILDALQPASVKSPDDESEVATDSSFRKFCLLTVVIGFMIYAVSTALLWLTR